MKAVLFILFFSLILSSTISDIINVNNKNTKRKKQIDKFYDCLNKLGTDSFKHVINEKKGEKFAHILKYHSVSLSKKDKHAIKECRKQILIDSKNNYNNYDSEINNRVKLKRITEKKI